MGSTLSAVCRPVVASAVMIVSVLAGSASAQVTLPDEIVLWTSKVAAADAHGEWQRISDSSAAGGFALHNPNRGRSKVAPALAAPANYFEIAFTAKRATAYHLWIRMRAQDNAKGNDSVHVQFNDAVNGSGAPIARIGTTGSVEPVLQNGPGGATPRGWGWTDNGWGSLGTPIYFAADGTHVMRIQQREDGAIVDQIVLSARTYSSTPPGTRRDDTAILPATSGGGLVAPSTGTIVIRPATAAAGRIYGSWQIISDSSAAGGQAVRNPNAGAARIAPALANPASYFEATFSASAGRPYHVWLRMRADSNSTANDSVHVQFGGAVTSTGSPTARIGTSSSLEAVLQDGSSAPAPLGWGWTDNGWGSLGPHIYFATSGTQTIRVQQREDGATIDQIVISPDTYLTTPPGWRRSDQTIVPVTTTAPPPANVPPTVTLTSPVSGATFTAPATIAFAASASDPENRLARVEFYNGSTRLATDTASPFTFSWGSVAAGTYQLRAVAFDADGASTASAIATVTVSSVSQPSPLPSGQQHQDVGSPAIPGSASFSNGTYTVTGAGTDIWDSHDEFHFVYQQMTGDLEIVARIASLQGSNAWSKGGLMVRESLADNARHAFAHLTVGSGYRLMQRAATGGSTSSALCVSGTAPGWVRLRRSGNVFEMQHSTDGSSWATCRSTQVSMASSVYVGLAVSNVDATGRATAIFDNVSVVPGTNRPPTVTLTSPLSGAAFTAPATIAFAATASDPENRLARVEFYNGSTRLATDTASPFTFSWGSVTAGTYQLRAVAFDADGASAASAIATVTVGSSTTPTKRVAFTASADHAVVTSYLLEVFSPTANTATAPALASSDLGKPTPSSTGEIIVDRTTFLNGLAAGNYLVTVAAVNSGGKSRSAAISFTR